MKQIILNRIAYKRKELERCREVNDYAKCLYVDGQIFALEMVLIDLNDKALSNKVDPADRCPMCGGSGKAIGVLDVEEYYED